MRTLTAAIGQPFNKSALAWLLAPSVPDILFALRTASAACLSLLIAMWMELDSPQWAPLTVWVVALSSRGESLSKARWRIFGTLVGCCAAFVLIAAFPQEPGLFFCSLALWIGVCCGLATFGTGYRAYGLLVTSFTSAIVASGAIMQPDNIFDIAMARSSYIILGIVCEATLAVLFMPGLQEQAQKRLLERLNTTLLSTNQGIASLIHHPRAITLEPALSALLTANARAEYDALEMGPHSHAADHARAAFAGMITMLARGYGLALTHQLTPTEHTMLADEAAIRQHIQACMYPKSRDHFRFRLQSRRHAVEAMDNGIRACLGILGAWLVWEVTAWPAGPTFFSFVSLVYGLLATRENPLLAAAPFFKGALWCGLIAALYALLVIPAITAPELLVLFLFIPMIIGGLAARHAHTAGYAFSFNMFLPVLLGPANQGRFDEQSFFNTTLAFLGAVLFARWTFLIIFPFRLDSHMRRTRRWIEKSLNHLARTGDKTLPHIWLSRNAESLVRIINTSKALPQEKTEHYIQEQIIYMVKGLYLIFLRDTLKDKTLSEALKTEIKKILRVWASGSPLRMQQTQDFLNRLKQEDFPPSSPDHARMEKICTYLHVLAAPMK